MTRPLIYLIAIFALWLYFKYGSFGMVNNRDTANRTFGETKGGGGFSSSRGVSK